MFEYIDKEPLASASIGQVHKAKLKKYDKHICDIDSRKHKDYNVIIKIQHEGIDQFLSSDISTLKKVSWAFGLIDKNFYFTDFIDEWQDSASRELNYKYELYHQLLAYNSFKKSGIPVKIPKIYCAHTTSKVLVMEYIKGFKITDTELLKKYNVDTYKMVYKIIDYFAYQIHNDGFFHGDPHPGNILVMMEEKKKRKRKKKYNKDKINNSKMKMKNENIYMNKRKKNHKKSNRNSKKKLRSCKKKKLEINKEREKGEEKKKNMYNNNDINYCENKNEDIITNNPKLQNNSSDMKNIIKFTSYSKSVSSSNASLMDHFVDSRYNIDKMRAPNNFSNPFHKSFSFVDYSLNQDVDSDKMNQEDYEYILKENMSDGLDNMKNCLSISHEYISCDQSRSGVTSIATSRKTQNRDSNKASENSIMESRETTMFSFVNNMEELVKMKSETKTDLQIKGNDKKVVKGSKCDNKK